MKDRIGEIFTLEEVAAYLSVGKRTVYRLAAARKIPTFKVGGAWRFAWTDVDRGSGSSWLWSEGTSALTQRRKGMDREADPQ